MRRLISVLLTVLILMSAFSFAEKDFSVEEQTAAKVGFAIRPNGDSAEVVLYLKNEDGSAKLVDGKLVTESFYKENGYYTYYGTHIVAVALPDGNVYVEMAYIDGKYIKLRYMIYAVTDEGFTELSSVKFASQKASCEMVNVRLEDGSIGNATLNTIDTDMLNRAFADYGIEFTYGYNVYSYYRKHDINYSYAVIDDAYVLLDVREDFKGLVETWNLNK